MTTAKIPTASSGQRATGSGQRAADSGQRAGSVQWVAPKVTMSAAGVLNNLKHGAAMQIRNRAMALKEMES